MQCDYCGRQLGKWNLDERQMIMCGLCVQRLLGYTAIQRPQLVPKQQTGVSKGMYIDKPWNRKKLPLKWENLL